MAGKRSLILLSRKDWLSQSMIQTGKVNAVPVYREIHGFAKMLFKLNYKFNIGNKSHWYNSEWTERLADYNKIILFDIFDDTDIAEYIHYSAPNARLIIYYYNIIKNIKLLQKLKRIGCEIWSFDKNDCKEYNLLYNPQFYFLNLHFDEEELQDFDYTSDIFFVGKDKKRLTKLKELDTKLCHEGIRTKILVVGDRQERYTEEQKNYLSKSISYAECVEYVKHTKCVLDIVQQGQKGMTLRIVEAMFFNKKLITNNEDILGMDFYDPKNIYIIGYDNRSVKDFILDGSARWRGKYISKYSFENWLMNFDNKEV